MNKEEYSIYVNKKNNEFALWLNDVFKEKKLAKKVKKALSKEEIIALLIPPSQQVKEESKK